MSDLCPCGSSSEYEQCCSKLHKNEKIALTALECMKARYCAYVKGELEFLKETHHPDFSKDTNWKETEVWSKESEWLGLEIVRTEAGEKDDDSGIVEFRASYKFQGKRVDHQEVSEFKKVENKWYFLDGKTVGGPIQRVGEKVGRNEPCGSGKKYKKCCL